ncbi:PQQ-dependent sugar dehydrogenase [Leucobacter sp. CSA1]|uniref:PQQ-dependent sugar dehydrogenase n=1 Tax=Leucobacter chromiisoli TaxID=2796471 RepID=A0A934UWK0_9MICO|nr:PQQ-dependent sugar dehydrogenase [Leucobacter chromiisoli]
MYSLGHRNPQGLGWSPEGELFVAEHGENAHDEINLIEAGGDYGWPTVEGDENEDGLVAPYLHSGIETWAPSGAAFAGDEFVFAALRGTGVYVVTDADTAEMVFTSDERVRAV